MAEVVSIEMSEDKRTMLETIAAYEEEIKEARLQIDVLQFGLGVLRQTVKEEFK
jgi:hypothetical protein